MVYVVDPSEERVEKTENGWVIEVKGEVDEEIVMDKKTVVMVNKSDTKKDLQQPIMVKTQNGNFKKCSLLISALKDE